MDKKAIVGVSGGSDSMTLLDKLRREEKNIIVAHVNYKKRESADRDEKIVREYCEKYKLEVKVYYPSGTKGNFQAWSRKERLSFFKSLAKPGDIIYLGHHYNDHLETYLIQKQSQRIPLHWGLKEETKINELVIKRPLLHLNKSDILNYCKEEQLVYGEDETNMSSRYLRNRIRKQLTGYTKEQLKSLASEIDRENKELALFYKKLSQIKIKEELILEEYKKISQEFKLEYLRRWLLQNGMASKHFSLKHLRGIDDFLKSKNHGKYQLNNFFIYKTYGRAVIASNNSYRYLLSNKEDLITPYFRLEFKSQGFYLESSGFPYFVRSPLPGDSINKKYGRKKLSRWFIDNKIPNYQREIWPVIVNKDQEVVYIYGLSDNKEDFVGIPWLIMLK